MPGSKRWSRAKTGESRTIFQLLATEIYPYLEVRAQCLSATQNPLDFPPGMAIFAAEIVSLKVP